MARRQTATDIAEWAEAQDQPKPDAANKGAAHLTGHDVADVLRWYAQGLSGEQIALKFTPPKHPTTITRAIARFGVDNTAEAKRILRGGAADMALNIVRRGQPKDQVQALKGLGVLEDGSAVKVSVAVFGDGLRPIGPRPQLTLSPPSIEVTSESVRNP